MRTGDDCRLQAPYAYANLAAKMIRKAFLMKIYPGREEEYERRHNPIWPELEKTLNDHGVHNYSIFLDSDSGHLFAYAEIEDEKRWAEIAGTEICRRWWAHMKEIMEHNPDNSPRAKPLRELFHLTRKG